MRIHFIAIGGAAMHNLAIALHKKGYIVTGSDDEIFDPALSHLKKYNLLPEKYGWYPEKINKQIDIIILGMHARKDNPELLQAQAQNLKIFSYPEYLYEQTKNKKRIVIGGSHGKTTITSMLMHLLKYAGISFDYMVGASIKNFETMVNLEDTNKIAIFEGDEYLSSPIDLTPKFHWYKPHIAVLTGIAWDHINVFPTFQNYCLQFKIFIDSIQKDGKLFWFADDIELKKISSSNQNIISLPYKEFESYYDDEANLLVKSENKSYHLNIFGSHNLQNLKAAYLVSKELNIEDDIFWKAMQSFEGAAKRLQLVKENKHSAFYIDFAHAPSKLKATIQAIKQKYNKRKLVACIELHTFSSLQIDFIPQYKNSMSEADIAVVYYNNEVLKHKQLPELDEQYVKDCFGEVLVITDTNKLQDYLKTIEIIDCNILMMSSGNFNGISFSSLADEIINDV